MQTLEQIHTELEDAHPTLTEVINGEVVTLSEEQRQQTLQAWAQSQFDAQYALHVPPPVTRRQLKRWLHSRGLLEAVPQLIANIVDIDARSLAQIDWEDASTFDADNPLVLSFAAALGMSRQQLHAAWIEAAQIQ